MLVACVLGPTAGGHTQATTHPSPRIARHRRYSPARILSLSNPGGLIVENKVLVTISSAETDEASFSTHGLLGIKPLPRPLFQALHPRPTMFSTT